MNEARRAGLIAMIIGGLICIWQIFEFTKADSFTMWIIGCIPLPVIVIGIIFLLGGLTVLIRGGK